MIREPAKGDVGGPAIPNMVGSIPRFSPSRRCSSAAEQGSHKPNGIPGPSVNQRFTGGDFLAYWLVLPQGGVVLAEFGHSDGHNSQAPMRSAVAWALLRERSTTLLPSECWFVPTELPRWPREFFTFSWATLRVLVAECGIVIPLPQAPHQRLRARQLRGTRPPGTERRARRRGRLVRPAEQRGLLGAPHRPLLAFHGPLRPGHGARRRRPMRISLTP
jgi:hypothetical protein